LHATGDRAVFNDRRNGSIEGTHIARLPVAGVTAPDAPACGGAEALAKLKSLLRPNEFVDVTYEPTLTDATDKDGNTLAYAITGAGVTQDIGLRLVRDGFAAASYPEGETAPKRFGQYATSSKGAVDQKLGIWASCPAPTV
jgi:endonuclease YncB( thermonuclease family)